MSSAKDIPESLSALLAFITSHLSSRNLNLTITGRILFRVFFTQSMTNFNCIWLQGNSKFLLYNFFNFSLSNVISGFCYHEDYHVLSPGILVISTERILAETMFSLSTSFSLSNLSFFSFNSFLERKLKI